MKPATTHEYLVRLLDTILEEREFAKALNIKGMVAAMTEKDALLQHLAPVQIIDEQDKTIASLIRQENRRNAFLFKSTLGWIRDTMTFLGQKSVTSTYSPTAYAVTSQVNGRLLSGRI